MEEKNIKQVILYENANITNNFNIQELQIYNMNTERKKIYEKMREEKPLFLNEDIELSSDEISNHYKYVKEFCKLVGIKYDEKQERIKEEWIQYKNIEASNFGRVRIDKRIIITQKETNENSQGYLVLDKEKYKKEYNNLPSMEVYRLVAGAWLDTRGCFAAIHHITNAGYDNRPENLIRLSKCEHRKVHKDGGFPRQCDHHSNCTKTEKV